MPPQPQRPLVGFVNRDSNGEHNGRVVVGGRSAPEEGKGDRGGVTVCGDAAWEELLQWEKE
eukprot:scaffold12397_cov124-Isochrysis_galbana.AAC.6